MSLERAPEPSPWQDALLAAELLAIDPHGLGGVVLRSLPGPVRERWLAYARALLPGDMPWRRLPTAIQDDRLLGGLDLEASIKAGRPLAQRGLLSACDGGIIVVAMAERLSDGTTARLTQVMDSGSVTLARDGLTEAHPARIGVVALDEAVAEDEGLPAALLDRLALAVDLHPVSVRDAIPRDPPSGLVQAARACLFAVEVDETTLQTLCKAALALGIGSLRLSMLAVHAARLIAARGGRDHVTHEDAATACRLVLAPRAVSLPTDAPADAPAERDTPPPDSQAAAQEEEQRHADATPPEDMVVEAAEARLPEDLLARIKPHATRGVSPRAPGQAGAAGKGASRGRPLASRPGTLGRGARLDLVATLRAAAPWQKLRADGAGGGLRVRRQDFRVRRYEQRRPSLTIFVVDASGSAAAQRLAEAKGAVELLLADCYIRRDRVALVAFRGTRAELILPPTRSLVRAKRCLAALPGGGGTPLGAAITMASALALAARRQGETPALVFLTDGRANITRDGLADRVRAGEEAAAAARLVRGQELTSILIDVAPRPRETASGLAHEMAAHYLPLPRADATRVSQAVRGLVT